MWEPNLSARQGPVYLAIADALAEDVAAGRLAPGERLPTHRDLAYRLGVTVGTITRAYQEADRRGLTGGEVGRGTFVRTPAPSAAGDTVTRLPEPAPGTPGTPEVNPLDLLYHPSLSTVETRLDLSLNYPYAAAQGLALDAGLRRMTDGAMLQAIARYQAPNGMTEHRRAAADWLAYLGVDARIDDILLVPGCQSAFAVVTTALTRPGDVVLHEELTWPGMKAVVGALGLRARAVEMDEHGLRPDALDAACREHRPRLLYVMPTLHNPTAIVMPEERRRQIAAVALQHELFVIEDDVYGFLLDERPPPLRTFAPDLAIYVTSLSKAVAAGLRVGFICAPAGLAGTLAMSIRANLLMTSSVATQIATEIIRSGAAEEAAVAQRREARARQHMAAQLLSGLNFRTHPQAFHGWLEVPRPWRRDAFIDHLLQRDVVVTPGDAFAGDPPAREAANHVRLCLCAIAEHERLATALAIVAHAARGAPISPMPVI